MDTSDKQGGLSIGISSQSDFLPQSCWYKRAGLHVMQIQLAFDLPIQPLPTMASNSIERT